MKKQSISRRSFIHKSSLAAAALSSGSFILSNCRGTTTKMTDTGIPMRTLGKTGESITILGYGGGSQFLRMPDGEWEPHMEYAIKAGINYFDTASNYQWDANQHSETRFGQILPPYRDKIILLTKIHERDPEKAKEEFEMCLKRLKTDHVDILLIHSIQPDDDLKIIENGIYKVINDFRDQKMVRYIGLSSMDSAERTKELIENLDFDVTLLAMNPSQYGKFATITLPAARQKNMGIIGMKVMRDIVNKYATPRELIEYVWNLKGIHCALVSHTGMDPLMENIQLAKDYGKQLVGNINARTLEKRLAHLAGPDYLVYARPGYVDGGGLV